MDDRDLRAADRLALFLFLYGTATIAAVMISLAFPLEFFEGQIPSPFTSSLPELLLRGEATLLWNHVLLAAYGAGMLFAGTLLGRRVLAEAARLESVARARR